MATKFLLQTGITYVLNVTSTEYTKRTKYFKYLNLYIYNTSNDDIKKHFRITNRFIKDVYNKINIIKNIKKCLEQKGKILVHS